MGKEKIIQINAAGPIGWQLRENCEIRTYITTQQNKFQKNQRVYIKNRSYILENEIQKKIDILLG